ncbi:MAG: DNA methyltransferase [Erysipelotrichales bacterium]|nr:DNA methyltransferase [Erysipelotrichales bacterium]
MAQQKLELTWYGKDNDIKVEPRLLIENPNLSYKSQNRDLFSGATYDNMLIHGDNLIALKSLEKDYASKIKCIYIDPPYNTGSAFEQYDDNIEHSLWLSLMSKRIEIMKNLLSEEGSIWISIDDDERDYLKIVCDEVFGRQNFIASIIWQKKHTRSNDAKWFSDNHDYILVYAKNKSRFKLNLLPRSSLKSDTYSNVDNDYRGPWSSGPCHVKTPNEKDIYEIITPSGRKVSPPPGTSWRFSKEKFEELIKDNRIYFGKDGSNIPRFKRFLTDVQDGVVPLTIWTREEVGDNQEAKKEVKFTNNSDVFATPKPERLIERILYLSTDVGDLVLDSFLGSGTTSSVAHKMKRRWIGVELGSHAYSHCKVRLDNVINGIDKTGITSSQNWIGGGGYKFYELAPSLIKVDDFVQLIINSEYNADMLATAIALHEGYKYEPDQSVFWKQAKNGDSSYLFTTTKHLDRTYLEAIHAQMNDDEFLVISCKSFESNIRHLYKNISIKKIPQSLLKNCEFGVDNYNLNIINPPMYEEDDEDE